MKSVNLDTLRRSTLTTLQIRFNEDASSRFEKIIFDASVKISEETGQTIEKVYPSYCYEKIGELMNSKKNNRELILKDIENCVHSYSSAFYNPNLEKMKETLAKLLLKPKPLKTGHKCKKCGNDEFYIWTQQTQSADEGSTQFRQCSRCGQRGRG